MNSRRQLFILVLLMSILLVTPLVEAFPVTVTDSLGREVTVTKRPQRIISLAPASTENLFRLGLADRIVGSPSFATTARGGSKPKVGTFSPLVWRWSSSRNQIWWTAGLARYFTDTTSSKNWVFLTS